MNAPKRLSKRIAAYLFQLGHAPPAQGLEVKIIFANRTFPIFAAQEAIRPGTVNAAPTEALPPARTFRSRAALGANRKIFVLPECSAARSSRLKISSTLRSLLFPVVRRRCRRCYSWECCGDCGSFCCHPHPRCSRSGVQRRQRAAADPAFIVGGKGGRRLWLRRPQFWNWRQQPTRSAAPKPITPSRQQHVCRN